MGARSSNTNRKGHRSQSDNRLLNGHAANFFNSNLNAGSIGPNAAAYTSTGGTELEIAGYKYHIFLGTVDSSNPAPFTIGNGPAPVEFILIGGGGGVQIAGGRGMVSKNLGPEIDSELVSGDGPRSQLGAIDARHIDGNGSAKRQGAPAGKGGACVDRYAVSCQL